MLLLWLMRSLEVVPRGQRSCVVYLYTPHVLYIRIGRKPVRRLDISAAPGVGILSDEEREVSQCLMRIN